MDEKKVEACVDRLFNEMNAGMSCLNLYVGHRLGLFQALADAGSATSHDISHSTGYVERYVREWLECMTAGRYPTHDADSEILSLPEEHTAALLDPDSPSSAIGVMGWVPRFASVAVLPIENPQFRFYRLNP
ncbi:MAG: hypothetical protein MK524_05625 [SAR202 cluster bacterium]|jgi:hypothetical protein|nr:hypothetical protein [SAR202 cluster bacterium]